MKEWRKHTLPTWLNNSCPGIPKCPVSQTHGLLILQYADATGQFSWPTVALCYTMVISAIQTKNQQYMA